MILKTDFRDSGASELVDYIQRDRSEDSGAAVELKNPAGRALSEPEVEQFVNKTREFQFQRHLIVSPDPTGSYSPAEVSANTREFMNHEFASEPTTDYIYAVHRDTEFPHAHIAATGDQAELEMDREEIRRLRSRAAAIYKEPTRTKGASEAIRDTDQTPIQATDTENRERFHEQELELEEQPEKELQRNTEQSKETAPAVPQSEAQRDTDRSGQRQSESEPTREADSTRELEPNREQGPETEPDREPEPERDMDRTIGG